MLSDSHSPDAHLQASPLQNSNPLNRRLGLFILMSTRTAHSPILEESLGPYNLRDGQIIKGAEEICSFLPASTRVEFERRVDASTRQVANMGTSSAASVGWTASNCHTLLYM